MSVLLKRLLSLFICGSLAACGTLSPNAQAIFDGVSRDAQWAKIVDLSEGRSGYVDLRTLNISDGRVTAWFQLPSLEQISIDCYAKTFSLKVFNYDLVETYTNSLIESTVQNSTIRLISEKLCDRLIPALGASARYLASDNDTAVYFFPYLTFRPGNKPVVITRLYVSSPAGARPATPTRESLFAVLENNCSNSTFRWSPQGQQWDELSSIDENLPWTSFASGSRSAAISRQLCSMTGLPSNSPVPFRVNSSTPKPMDSNPQHPAVRCIGQGLKPGTSEFSKCIAN
jgi:hypothetical protein